MRLKKGTGKMEQVMLKKIMKRVGDEKVQRNLASVVKIGKKKRFMSTSKILFNYSR